MLVGKTVAFDDDTGPQYGHIWRVHTNVATFSPYMPISEQSSYYVELLSTIEEEQTRANNLLLQIQQLSTSLQAEPSVEKGNVEMMILEWSQRRLQKMDLTQLQKLCSLSKPSEPAFTVLSAAASLVLRLSSPPTWATTRRTVGKKEFLETVQEVGTLQLPTDVYNFVLDTFLSSSHFSSLNNETVGGGPLNDVLLLKKWITSVMDYQRSRFGVNEKVEVQQQLDASKLSLAASKRRLQAAQQQIELVRHAQLLSLDTTTRLTKAISSIQLIVPDCALDDNGKFLNVNKCLLNKHHSEGQVGPFSPAAEATENASHVQEADRSRSNILSEVVTVVRTLDTQHKGLVAECENLQMQRDNLLDIAQYLLVCMDDTREEIFRISHSLAESKRINLLGKSLIQVLRTPHLACHTPDVTNQETVCFERKGALLESSRLALAADEFLRGLSAARVF